MYNKIKKRKLGRTASHRKALLKNLANQLIEHKEIRTTTAKAKEMRPYVERLITYAKKGSLHHRRLVFSFLRNKQSINILFDEIAPVYENRQGGYTRVIKLGNRNGDDAPISLIQLVDFEKLGESTKKKSEKKKVKSAGEKVEKATTEKETRTTSESEKVETPKVDDKKSDSSEIIDEPDKKEDNDSSSESEIKNKDENVKPPTEEKQESEKSKNDKEK